MTASFYEVPTTLRAAALRAWLLILSLCCATSQPGRAQGGEGRTYTNPVLFADYSDPDVIRHGKDYYLVASSFHFVPAIPILHSLDLVHWEILGHVLPRLDLNPAYNFEGGDRYAGGVWAPALRFHNGLFYVYFPTPAEGIFVSTAPDMTGPWSKPVAVVPGPGFEDPCPFWDDDGKAYLVHSKLHAGPLILHRMAPDGKSVLDEGKLIVQDAKDLPTLEGPKFYKRNGWYYIFAPMGGVGGGSQAVLRSRDIYGPYEHRIVLSQGKTAINGPHQGGYVETPDGQGWFLHFQLRDGHGRIVHLEPVRWKDDWPVMGEVLPGAIIGQPVAYGALPVIAADAQSMRPQTSDEFDSDKLAAMWEWNHNPDDTQWSLRERKGFLRLHPSLSKDLLHARNTLTESLQDESMQFTAKLELAHMGNNTVTGVSMFDKHQTYLGVEQVQGARRLVVMANGAATVGPVLQGDSIQLRVKLLVNQATYSYSMDGGATFLPLGEPDTLVFSWWKGARPAIFSFTKDGASASKYVDVDWAHYQALDKD